MVSSAKSSPPTGRRDKREKEVPKRQHHHQQQQQQREKEQEDAAELTVVGSDLSTSSPTSSHQPTTITRVESDDDSFELRELLDLPPFAGASSPSPLPSLIHASTNKPRSAVVVETVTDEEEDEDEGLIDTDSGCSPTAKYDVKLLGEIDEEDDDDVVVETPAASPKAAAAATAGGATKEEEKEEDIKGRQLGAKLYNFNPNHTAVTIGLWCTSAVIAGAMCYGRWHMQFVR